MSGPPYLMIRLTSTLKDGRLRGFFCDMKVCHITGSRAARGSVIHRRGLAKKKGGVGRHITKMVPRIFAPNLQRQRIWVPELKKFVRVRVTARGLKTINKQGACKALKKGGAILYCRASVPDAEGVSQRRPTAIVYVLAR